MNEGFVTGGLYAGFAVVALLGVMLGLRSAALRAALVPYIGERPALWSVYAAWFAYVVSALNALASANTVFPAFSPDTQLPPALGFLYGGLFHPLLAFANSVVPLAHIAALVTAAVLLYRLLKGQAT